MSYRYVSEIRRENTVETLVKAIFAFLDERGVEIGEDDRARIAECADIAQLGRWMMRAPYAGSAAELFED